MAGDVKTELTIEEVKELSDRLQSGYDEKGIDNPDMMQIITTLKNVGEKMEEQGRCCGSCEFQMGGLCVNTTVNAAVRFSDAFEPDNDFYCNQWEVKTW